MEDFLHPRYRDASVPASLSISRVGAGEVELISALTTAYLERVRDGLIRQYALDLDGVGP